MESEIGQDYGRTSYSEYADAYYERARKKRGAFSASEYTAVVQGFL